MKVYIGNREINDESYKKIATPEILNVIADDSECTSIVLDNILKRYSINDALSIIGLAVKKLRMSGILCINDIDFDLLVFVYRKSSDLIALNQGVCDANGFKSFLSLELIIKTIGEHFPSLELTSSQINNIEFRLEFKRKS